jgi:hypothetical protein
VLYACEIALKEPMVKDWVKSFSQTAMVRQRFPSAFEQSHLLLEEGRFSSVIGDLTIREFFDYSCVVGGLIAPIPNL